jgi:hypothetical protein
VKRNYLAIQRDTLNEASDLLCRYVIDNDELPDEVREQANFVQFALSEIACYQPASAEGEREIRLVPIGFKWAQFYTHMVDEFVLDLYGEEPTDIRSIRVLLARQSAVVVDDMLYSTDFRLQNLDTLNEILASMKREAAEAEGDAEAGDDEIPNETIELGYNAAPK